MSHPTALYGLNGHLFPLVVANPNLPLVHSQNAELSLANIDRDQKRVIKVVIPANYCFIVLSEADTRAPSPMSPSVPELFLSEI